MAVNHVPGRRRCASGLTAGALLLFLLAPPPAAAQTSAPAPARPPKIAVIDVQRILTESKLGKEALARLKTVQEQKLAESKQRQEAISQIRARIAEGQLSLSEEKIAELQKQLEEQVISFRRFQDDAERELQKLRDETFAAIEQRVMPIINQMGRELGYTLIFNKFESGLLFAQEEVDITSAIIQRFDGGTTQGG